MAFKKPVPLWEAAGTEPPADLKKSGFTAGYKPPADFFNWFWNGTSEALSEIQNAGVLAYLGANPINKEGDTVSAWVALGSGYARYTNAGTLTDKPSTYGILINFCVDGNDMFQLWYDTPSGPLYHRGGNASGWFGTWKKVYDDVYKPSVDDVIGTALGISKGGTGATTRKDAFRSIGFLGADPISAVADDTIDNWIALGSGYAWYSKGGQLTNQPSNYGLLLNYVPNTYEVTQIWKCHASGPIWIRSGNAQGWGQTWAMLYDSLNRPTFDNIDGIAPLSKGGTGATSAAGALVALRAFRKLDNNVVSSSEDDTITTWSQIDSGYSYYSTKGCLNEQPSQYGILIHFHQSSETFQIWRTQSGGPTYWRSGNAQGWYSSWAKVYDASNKPTLNELRIFHGTEEERDAHAAQEGDVWFVVESGDDA